MYLVYNRFNVMVFNDIIHKNKQHTNLQQIYFQMNNFM